MSRHKKLIAGGTALGLAMSATFALGHSGATGIVLERMNGMTSMRDLMRDLAPIVQGAVPYDALKVSESGFVIASHAGETLRSLFPEGSTQGVTFAKAEIWSDWDDFAELADELERYATALSDSAALGLDGVADPAPGGGIEMDETAMDAEDAGKPDPEQTRQQEIAILLGYSARSKNSGATGIPKGSAQSAFAPGKLAVADIFERIGGACSACHARYRQGRN